MTRVRDYIRRADEGQHPETRKFNTMTSYQMVGLLNEISARNGVHVDLKLLCDGFRHGSINMSKEDAIKALKDSKCEMDIYVCASGNRYVYRTSTSAQAETGMSTR